MQASIITEGLPQFQYNANIVTIALCITLGLILHMTHERKGSKLRILYIMLTTEFCSAVSKMLYQMELFSDHPALWKIYVFRSVHHILLTGVLLMYTLYLYDPLWIPRHIQRKNMRASAAACILSVVVDISGSISGYGFRIQPDGRVHTGINAYMFIFAMLCVQIFYMIIRYRSRMLRQVFWSLIGTNSLAVFLLLAQERHHNISYTTFAYFIPVIGLIFMFHSNPFDVETGAMSDAYAQTELEEILSHGTEMFLIYCNIRGFSEQMKTSKDFKTEYYSFLRGHVKKGVLYSSSDGKLTLMLKKPKDGTGEETIKHILESFNESYQKFRLEYKIVIAETTKEIQSAGDYFKLIEEAEQEMPYNDIHRISEQDIKKFYASSYILSQLEDIARRNTLSDERVLVYCQPIYNLATGHYDTAEALMRLKLEKTGMVFPDQFIPLAEKHNYIHALSLIILDKTCAAIRDFMEEGYEIQRASVNFSTNDLRYSSFCKEIQHIIDRNGIPYDHIAVEITESQSDADFNLVKEKVEELQKLGIKFYLDDFGTGYSNFERIMEIPFDIIKFDRSMLIELAKSESSRFMVNTFADMFHKLHYTVLFEGVENDIDQENCINMNAKYLQGYKFSRPIPIAELRNFLHKPERPAKQNKS